MSVEYRGKPVRVCFVMPKAYPLFNPKVAGVFGGAEVDLYLLAVELAEDSGFDVDFITADYGQGDVENVGAVRILKSLDFKRSQLSGVIRIWRALKKSDADIYVIKTASMGAALVAFFCKLHKKVFVYRAASSGESDGRYVKENFALGKAFKYTLRNAKVVFTQNIADGKNMKETIGIDSIVVRNGHHLPDMPTESKQLVLWVGRSEDVKGPEKFISLAGRFSDEKFVMICQRATGDDQYEQLRCEAEKVANLVFHKQVPFGEIDEYFRRARVLVNTSDSEGFANTFIQAFKAGAAVLSLNVNPDRVLDEYGCGVSCDGDEERLADELRAMLEGEKYLEMGKKGRAYVEENHDITKIVARYKTVFRELM